MEKLKETTRFSVLIRDSDPVTNCHRVHGVNIMPGVCFLDVMYRALKSMGYPVKTIELRNILFKLPVATTSLYDRKVTVTLEKKNGYLSAKASSKKVKDGRELDGEADENFECEVHRVDRMVHRANIDINRLMSEAESVTDMDQVYEFTGRLDICHYDFMKGLGQTYAGGSYLLTRLHLRPAAQEYLNSFCVHPVLLDASTLVPFFFYSRNCNNDKPYIPIYIEHFRLLEEMKGVCYMHMSRPEPAGSLSDILSSDYCIYNEEGRLAAVFGKLTGKQIRSEEIIKKLGDIRHQGKAETDMPVYGHTGSYPGNTDNGSAKSELLDIVAGYSGKLSRDINTKASFYDLGLDSVQLMKIVQELEKRLVSKLYPTLLFEYQTVDELSGFLEREYGKCFNTAVEGASDVKTPLAPGTQPYDMGTHDKKAGEKGPAHINESLVCFRDGWCEAKTEVAAMKTPENILLLDEGEGLRNVLTERLGSGTSHIVLVKPGTGFRELGDGIYEIDPCVEEDYDRLMDALLHIGNMPSGSLPDAVIHSWSRETGDIEFGETENILGRGIKALFSLSRAIMKYASRQPAQILYMYPGSKSAVNPLHSAISGFARTICLENPRLSCKTVAIPYWGEDAVRTKADIVFQEFIQKDKAVEVMYESGLRRLVKQFYEWNPDGKASREAFPVKENGVYLITGGMGGLGVIFAQWLARRKKCSFILAGRSPLDAKKQEKLGRITSLGSEVLYMEADISERNDVQNLFTKIKDRFETVNGVIHCAGVTRDSFIIKKTAKDINQVFAPKIYGTLLLDEFLAQEKLDFFIMTSSLSAVTGNPGQSDYAYANAFMDGFAAFRNQKVMEGSRFGKTLSINYPLWRDGGMGVDQPTLDSLEEIGFTVLETSDGLMVLEKGFANVKNRVALAAGDAAKIRAAIGIREDDGQDGQSVSQESVNKPGGRVTVLGNYESIKDTDSIPSFWQEAASHSALTGKGLAETYLELVTRELDKSAHLLVRTQSGLELETFVYGSGISGNGISGNGMPIIFVPPFGMTARIWSYQVMEFSKNHRVFIINKPGHGLSTRKDNISLKDMAGAIFEVIETLGAKEKVHLVGASFGGMVLQQFAADYPQKTASLVLSGSFSRLSHEFLSLSTEQAMNLFAGLGDKDLENMAAESAIDKHELIRLKDFMHKGMSLAPAAGTDYINSLLRVSTWEDLHRISAPVLIISGRKDVFKYALFHPDENQSMLSRLPNAQLAELTDAGHFPYVTHWQQFNAKVLPFVKEHE